VPTELGLGSDHADENRIIAQCLAGDRKAYTLLVERHKDLVHDLVYRMIGDAARAEDIAQDAFVKGYLSLRDFRGESRFSTWVCRIAINRCRDLLRRARREVLMPDGDPPLSESVDAGETPAAALERREREEVLRRALARLPLKYREAVVLRHIEGMEFREVGRLLGIAAGAAKVRTFRGREMLRRLLEREGFRDDAI
jgi:RNA polymerase sigma-70 factor (ECF subfamily)